MWSRNYFPQKRPPQNVWPCSRANLSPQQEEGVSLLSCQLPFLAKASKKIEILIFLLFWRAFPSNFFSALRRVSWVLLVFVYNDGHKGNSISSVAAATRAMNFKFIDMPVQQENDANVWHQVLCTHTKGFFIAQPHLHCTAGRDLSPPLWPFWTS